jgi:hypothetical protein
MDDRQEERSIGRGIEFRCGFDNANFGAAGTVTSGERGVEMRLPEEAQGRGDGKRNVIKSAFCRAGASSAENASSGRELSFTNDFGAVPAADACRRCICGARR